MHLARRMRYTTLALCKHALGMCVVLIVWATAWWFYLGVNRLQITDSYLPALYLSPDTSYQHDEWQAEDWVDWQRRSARVRFRYYLVDFEQFRQEGKPPNLDFQSVRFTPDRWKILSHAAASLGVIAVGYLLFAGAISRSRKVRKEQ